MTDLLNVLLVEDSEQDAALLVRELQRGGFQVEHERVETREAMRDALMREEGPAWDIVLCDFSLPRFDALAALALLRELGLHIPSIIVSGRMGEEHAVETMRAGAHDYIMKNALERLCGAVRRELQENRGYQARRQAEADLQRNLRALHALNACNEALIHASDELELLSEICRVIVEIAGYKMVWVGYALDDEEKTVKPVAHWGYGDDYVDSLEITWADKGRGKGPTGKAIRSGHPVVCRDIHNAPEFEPWRESAERHGYASSAAFPLVYGETTFGVLNIYARAVDGFRGEEHDLLLRLARNVAYGLNVLRSEEAKQLLQKELLQAQKMEAIGQLTGGIAHDFNNILASILGYSDLALLQCRQQGYDDVLDLIQPVKEAGERARDLIAQMMVFSRNDKRSSRRLHVQAVVMEAIKMLRASLPSSVEMKTHFIPDPVYVYEDPVRLHQVVMNLCINARDAMGGKGKIVISISHPRPLHAKCASCQAPIPSQPLVAIGVRDEGQGLDELLKSRIFEPFFTTKDVGKGTGMGLAVVHAIIHEQGGHILLDSEKGKGTEVTVLLPEMRMEVEAPAAESLELEETLHGNGERIMVVDDERSVANFLKDLLEAYGYRVEALTSSQAAYSRFAEDSGRYDLVITDQTMPQMVGYELAQKLLALQPGLPIILCTGYSDVVDEEKAKEVGIRAFFNKPWDNRQMLSQVKALLAP